MGNSTPRPLVHRVFRQKSEARNEPLPAIMFPLQGRTRVSELEEFYGIRVAAPPGRTLAELLRERLGERSRERGARVVPGGVALCVLDPGSGEVESVGLEIVSTGRS